MASEKEIQKKNLEAELAIIRNEIDSEAAKLTSILQKKVDAELFASALELDKKSFEEYKNKVEEKISLKRREMQNELSLHDQVFNSNQAKIRSLNSEIKEATKQLSWLNDKILKAEEVIGELETDKAALDSECANLLFLVSNKDEEEKKLNNIVSSRESIEKEIRNTEQAAIASAKNAELHVIKMQDDLKALTIQKDNIQYELKSYTDQLYTAMNDYEVVRTRLEFKFKQHYPELELPLMPV